MVAAAVVGGGGSGEREGEKTGGRGRTASNLLRAHHGGLGDRGGRGEN